MHLLLPASLVELHGLHGERVVEVGDRRIVERDMPVLADAHADDVDGRVTEEGGVPRALRRHGRRAVDEMRLADADAVEQVFRMKRPKLCGASGPQADGTHPCERR